jgi:hypothetical protein
VNTSLQSGVIDQSLKRATITPLLKKTSLDPDTLKNYRPISNLQFVSKILEKVALFELNNHLRRNNLMEVNQSAYRKNHSTETALLCVTDRLLTNGDKKLVSFLGLLDLSAAFDTLDHKILLRRLQVTFGITGSALRWFSSYLASRSQFVTVSGISSQEFPLLCGVPQGSVLGPVLFSLYTKPLSDVIENHDLDFHKYADDTEIDGSSSVDDYPALCDASVKCIDDVKDWMSRNRLKLNEDKTEIMSVGMPHTLKQIERDSIDIGQNVIQFKDSVKYLGVHLDQTLSMDKQVSALCRSAYFHLRKIRSVKSYLSEDTTKQLVISHVLSRLDYCNSVLAGLPSSTLRRLQVAQNNAARLILRKKMRDNASPLLRQLHWLPVEDRIKYKIAVLAYHQSKDSLPAYLSALINEYKPKTTVVLRSAGQKKLDRGGITKKTAGDRSFRQKIPEVWNSLPVSLRLAPSVASFKTGLKTHLFRSSAYLQSNDD